MDKNEIYKKYIKDIYKYTYFKLKNKEVAEDITSETFIRFFENSNKKVITKDQIKPYLIGITRNIIFDHFKNLTKSSSIVLDNIIEDSMDLNLKNKSMEEKIINDELLSILKNKLDLLDDDSKEIIILKVWEELKFEEISQIVKKTLSNVKNLYYRGIEYLTKELNVVSENEIINKSSVKLNSHIIATLPLLLILGNNSEYLPARKFIDTTLNKILSFNPLLMENTNSAGNIASTLGSNTTHLASSAAVKSISTGILSTASVKVIALATTAIIAVGGVAGAGILYQNSRNNKVVSYSVTSYANSSSSSIPYLSSSNSSILSSSSSSLQSSSNTKQVGLNLTFDTRIKFLQSTSNFILNSGNYLDSGYKVTDISNKGTIAYAVSDSKLYAEFYIAYESSPQASITNIVDLGNSGNLGDIKRFNSSLGSTDPNISFYTNQSINYQPNPMFDKVPFVDAYITDNQKVYSVFPKCKPLKGSDYSVCDNLIKSLTFSPNSNSNIVVEHSNLCNITYNYNKDMLEVYNSPNGTPADSSGTGFFNDGKASSIALHNKDLSKRQNDDPRGITFLDVVCYPTNDGTLTNLLKLLNNDSHPGIDTKVEARFIGNNSDLTNFNVQNKNIETKTTWLSDGVNLKGTVITTDNAVGYVNGYFYYISLSDTDPKDQARTNEANRVLNTMQFGVSN